MKKISLVILIVFICLTLFSCGIISIEPPENLDLIRAKYDEPFTFITTGGSMRQARTSESLYLPWNNSLYMVGTVKKGIYNKDESIPLDFTVGLNDGILPDGDLRITIFTDDFTAEMSGQSIQNNSYIIKDFFSKGADKGDAADFTIYLSPDYSDIWAADKIRVSAQYVPHDMEAFMEEMGKYLECTLGIVHDDYISLVSGELAYAADSVETWIKRGSSYGNVFSDITKYHYEKKIISSEEMAECYFEFKQKDTVNAYVYRYNESAHTMKIGYFSRNIRYIGEYTISDSELEEAILAHKAFWNENHYQPAKGGLNVALRILEIMLERGVITDAEYLTELDLIENIQGVHADFSEHNGSFPYTNYQEVNSLRETHKD